MKSVITYNEQASQQCIINGAHILDTELELLFVFCIVHILVSLRVVGLFWKY